MRIQNFIADDFKPARSVHLSDKAHSRAFRSPPSPPKSITPSGPQKGEVFFYPEKHLGKPTTSKMDFSSDVSLNSKPGSPYSNLPRKIDLYNQTSTGSRTWTYLGVGALTALSAFALATLMGFVAIAPIPEERVIPETHLSSLEQKTISLSPFYSDCLFGPNSLICRTLSLYADQLSFETTWDWSHLFSTSNILKVTHKTRPDIAYTCIQSNPEVTCSLNGKLDTNQGQMTHTITENSKEPDLDIGDTRITEKVCFEREEKEECAIAIYDINHKQLPDAMTQVFRPKEEAQLYPAFKRNMH